MTSFDKKYQRLLEGFGGPLTTRMYAPRIKLSENFIRAFREEYKQLCKPEQILDEDGNIAEEKSKNPKRILEQMKKALTFLAR
tara:strand:+ start:82 stop:330 length:249 start_codon:yes stop_codon:yes gene_type:complete